MFKISPSSLNLFKDCPRCFYLTIHKKWKRPSGPFPSLPGGMDAILKKHFDRFRDKNLLPPEISEHTHTKKMKLFADKELLKVWQSNFKGIQYKDRKGNILRGAVDNILVKGKKLIVLDYKTRGWAVKEDTAEHYRLQMDVYNFLLRKNKYETEDYTFLLFYYPNRVLEGGEVVFDTDLVKIKTSPNRAEKVWKEALQVLDSTKPKEKCKWCENI
jgi:hypothetical protein